MRISVIIPVYNVENYLAECIESVCNNDYNDLEIILVNDGSTDSSDSICDRYAGIDSRIKVIHKSNSGVSSARNSGIDVASGDYIAFLDGDDLVKSNIYRKLLDALQYNNVDIAICRFSDYVCGTEIVHTEPIPTGCLYGQDVWNNLVLDMLGTPLDKAKCAPIMGSICRGLYRKCIILANNIRFKNIKIAEDMLFHLEYLCCCKSAVVLSESLYMYRYNSQSVTHDYKHNLFETMQRQFSIVQDVLKSYGKFGELEQEYLMATWLYYVTWCINNECHANSKQSRIQIFKNMDILRNEKHYDGLLAHRVLKGIHWKERITFYMIKYRLWKLLYWYNRRKLLWGK